MGFEFYQDAIYRDDVPTFKSVLGYDPGEQLTRYAGLVCYLTALEQNADRVLLRPLRHNISRTAAVLSYHQQPYEFRTSRTYAIQRLQNLQTHGC